MKAPNLLALTASALIVGATLFVLRSADQTSAPMAAPLAATIDGIRVTQFDRIVIRPTAAQLSAAGNSSLGDKSHDDAFGLIGSQLVMPYYSFGKVLSNAGKE
jgi:hypothetical protein